MARRLPPLQIQPDSQTDIPHTWKFTQQRDFTGGENKQLTPELLGPNQLLSAQNCVLSADGVPETRKGKYKYNSSEFGTSGITSFHRFSMSDGSRYLLVQQGTALYGVVWDGVSPILSLGTSIKTLTSTNRLHYVTWKDRVFITNGVDNLFHVTYSSPSFVVADCAGSPPKSKIVKVYANRLWLVPITQPNAVQFSNLEDYTKWDILDIINIRDDDGDSIQALSPQEGGLIIAKTKSIWTLYGTNLDNFTVPAAPIFEEDGCVSQDSFLDVGIFLGQSSLYSFNLTQVTPVFSSHKPVIQDLSLGERTSSHGIVDPVNRRMLLYLGTGDTLCIQEQVSPTSGESYYAVLTWKNMNAGCFAVANDANDPCTLLIGDATDGYIYSLIDDTDDDGTPIETIIITTYDDKQSLGDKIWRRFVPDIEILAGATNYDLTLSYDLDYGTKSGSYFKNGVVTAFIWGTSLWGDLWGSTSRVKPEYHFEARGSQLSFGIQTEARIKLRGYIEKYREVVTQ